MEVRPMFAASGKLSPHPCDLTRPLSPLSLQASGYIYTYLAVLHATYVPTMQLGNIVRSDGVAGQSFESFQPLPETRLALASYVATGLPTVCCILFPRALSPADVDMRCNVLILGQVTMS